MRRKGVKIGCVHILNQMHDLEILEFAIWVFQVYAWFLFNVKQTFKSTHGWISYHLAW